MNNGDTMNKIIIDGGVKLSENETEVIDIEWEQSISSNNVLKVIEFKYKSPLIIIPKEWDEFDTEEKFRRMHRLASTMNHAADLLQQERNALLKELEIQKRSVENAETQVHIQKSINQQVIENLNTQTKDFAEKQAQLIDRINTLEAELTQFRLD